MLKLNIEKSWFDYHDTRCCNLAIQHMLPKLLPGPNLQFCFMKNSVYTSLLGSLTILYWFYLYDICKGKWNSCRAVKGQFFLEVHFHHIFIFPVFLWKTNSLLNSLEILSNFSHSQNYHYPSLPFINITLNYHSLPLPFITITLH